MKTSKLKIKPKLILDLMEEYFFVTFPILLLIIFLSRLPNLASKPLFIDEGIYISWSHLFSIDHSYAYLGLLDGKTPLYFWTVSFFRNFLSNTLFAARLVSVLGALVTAFSWMMLLYIVFSKRISLIFGVIFLITPFGFLIERMAFVDSLLEAFCSLSLLFMVMLFKSLSKIQFRSLVWALLSGFFLGLSYLVKPAAELILIVEVLILAFVTLSDLIRNFSTKKLVITFFSVAVFWGIYKEILNDLRVGAYRFWAGIAQKETGLIFSPSEILHNLLKPWHYLPHFYSTLQYFFFYENGIFILAILGAIFIFKRKINMVWLIFYPALIYLATLISSTLIASRYIYLLSPALGALAAIGLGNLLGSSKKFIPLIIVLFLVFPLVQSCLILTGSNLAFYSSDDYQLVQGTTVALGGEQTVKYLKNVKDPKQVGISAVWGVDQGLNVMLSDEGVASTVLPPKPLSSYKPSGKTCQNDDNLIKGLCYHLDIGSLNDKSFVRRFMYFNNQEINLTILNQLSPFKIVKQFSDGSKNESYLIQFI